MSFAKVLGTQRHPTSKLQGGFDPLTLLDMEKREAHLALAMAMSIAALPRRQRWHEGWNHQL
jgi:hypothetical protein